MRQRELKLQINKTTRKINKCRREEHTNDVKNGDNERDNKRKVKWATLGKITKSQYTFLYCGEEKRGSNGVEFYVSKEETIRGCPKKKLKNNIVNLFGKVPDL